MHFHVITLFPEVCRAYTDAGVLGRAQKTKKGKGAKVRGRKVQISYYNPRDFADNAARTVDDRPFGGGPGMVLRAPPVLRAWQRAVGRKRDASKVCTLIMSPRGKQFTHKHAAKYATNCTHLVLIAGRYEGVDARVKQALGASELSVGDYTLSGGELPALAVIDATARFVPGVLGASASLEQTRVASAAVYTRPASFSFRGADYQVPGVVRSGDHKAIEAWRMSSSTQNA